MDCQSPKLSLDLSPPWLPTHPSSSITGALVGEMKCVDNSSSSVELKENIARLEAELRKIEAFKRELPLSILILNEAIEKLKEEASMNRNQKGPSTSSDCWKVETKLESYDDDDDEDEQTDDKKSWMSSAQLWTSSNSNGCDHASFLQIKSKHNKQKQQQQPEDSNDDTVLNCKYSKTEGVTTSLDKERLSLSTTSSRELEAVTTSLSLNNGTGLCLVQPPPLTTLDVPARRIAKVEGSGGRQQQICGQGFTDQVVVRKSSPSTPVQQHQQQLTFKSGGRKQRRCWSPDLHRRFVDALEKLGGSQVATPKQIREVMQVDGLTNDEVKSHLQKYRLHIRKLPNTTMSLSRSGEEDSDEQEEGSNNNNHKSRISRCKDDDSDQSASPEGPLHLSSVLRGRAKSNSCASRCSLEGEEEMRDTEEERSDGMSVGKRHY